MISYQEAVARILSDLKSLGEEQVPLEEAPGRFLAREICAAWDLPAFDCSAMDGFAVVAAETPGELGAVSVLTGSRLPAGADAVVRQEAATVADGRVRVAQAVRPGENVRRRGDDAPAGRALLAAGTAIDAPAMAILATFGWSAVPVGRRPRVAILTAGDELHEPAEAAAGRVVDSNSFVVATLAREAGATARRLGIAPDRADDVVERLRAALEGADVVVTLGGSADGAHDVMREAFRRLGVEGGFWDVALAPGRPVGFGRAGGRLLYALPGNPAAAATTFELLVRPALLALQGAAAVDRPTVRGRLLDAARKPPEMTYFLRADARLDAEGVAVALPPAQGSARLVPALGTNALAVLPADRSALEPGDEIEVRLLGPLAPAQPPPVLCFVGWSGSGKTTLLSRVIARLSGEGLRIGALKHDAHEFQMDREGKDTWRFREAGARAVGIASKTARALIARTDRSLALRELVATLPRGLDLVLVEGYKGEDAPKIEVHRQGRPLLWRGGMTGVVALVTDDAAAESPGARFAHDDVDAVCAFVGAFAPAFARRGVA